MNKVIKRNIPNVLSIAGSDSSAGAGIQADLKTFAALGTYGTTAITAITAQNTCRIDAIHAIPEKVIEAQIRAVFDDIDISAVKIGMLGKKNIIELVARLLKEYQPEFIVLDPVMVSKSGNLLLEKDAISSLVEYLFPLTTLVTPNLPEAACLLNQPEASNKEEMTQTIYALSALGIKSTLLKGGHLEGNSCYDMLLHDEKIQTFEHIKKHTQNTHGTGCTLSSAIAANLSRGVDLPQAVQQATDYVNNSIHDLSSDSTLNHSDNTPILKVGKGHGPLSHFQHWWYG